MKKRLFYFSIFCFLTHWSFSQNTRWMLAPNYLKFESGWVTQLPLPTTTGGYQGAPATGAQNIITDATGKITLFIVDGYVYGRSGELIAQMNPTGIGEVGIISETMVIPDPEDCNLFHIITTQDPTTAGFPYAKAFYGKLQVSYNSQGILNPNSGFIFDPEITSDCSGVLTSIEAMVGVSYFEGNNNVHDERPILSAVKKPNNKDYFVFVQNGQRLFRFSITANNFAYDNAFTQLTTVFPTTIGMENESHRSELETIILPNGNYRLATINTNSSTSLISVMVIDLDGNGNFIAGSAKMCSYPTGFFTTASYTREIVSFEFSRNGNNLFIAHQPYGTSGSTLDVWNISGTPTKTELSTHLDFRYSQMEIDINGDILLARNNYLAKITNANTASPSLNLTAVAISSYPLSGPAQNLTYLRILQDQIDNLDYSFINPNVYNAINFSASTNATWKPNTIANSYNNNPLIYGFGSEVFIQKELRIPAGRSITIENMTIRFAPGARLVIENAPVGQQGGKLLLKNSILDVDNRCGLDEMWLGVEVWGNQNQSQGTVATTSQGLLRMLNSSQINNAQIGVLVGKRNSEMTYNPIFAGDCGFTSLPQVENVFPNSFNDANNGGIIQASINSSFNNNQLGVYIGAHNSPSNANNLSFFNRTNFNWNGTLLGNVQPQYHIYLNQVKGISIVSCDFMQNSPNLYSENNQGFGILSTYAQFSVNSSCNVTLPYGGTCTPANLNRSTFSGLTYGIYTLGSNAVFSGYNCNQSEFFNCRYGIASSSTNNAKITLNNFQVREATYQTAGVSLSTSKYYTIQENDFNEFNNASIPTANIQSYGIRINNGGVDDEDVYKNTFQNLRIGGLSERVNAGNILSNGGATGLTWTCNDFRSGIYEADLGVRGVIDFHQGLPIVTAIEDDARAAAARNRFSIGPDTGTEHDIKVYNHITSGYPNIQSISYVHLTDPFHIADDKDITVSLTPAQFGGGFPGPIGNYCPSKINVVGKKPLLVVSKLMIDSLDGVINSGNTAELKHQSYYLAEESATYTNLMSSSPYLSDEVLLNYLERCTQSGKVKDVMLANSPLTSAVKEAVASSTLPTAVKNTINAAQTGRSERTKVELQLKKQHENFTLTFNEVVNEIALDTTIVNSSDSLIQFLNSYSSLPEAKRALASVYMQERNFDKVNLMIAEMERDEDEEYLAFLNVQMDLQNATSYNAAVIENESLKENLQALSTSNNSEVAVSAKNILDFLDGKINDVEDFLPLDSPSGISIYQDESSNNTSSAQALIVHIYPNPSTGNVYFDLPKHEEGTMHIQLFDITGKEVFATTYYNSNGELVNLSGVKKGTYIVRITLGETYTESQLLQLRD